ncbi:MAG: hypothetical protein LIO42_01635 [Oscillospiraceae bacterium]|nr:hypothetical protein [Oscillospiraceae bacterium]
MRPVTLKRKKLLALLLALALLLGSLGDVTGAAQEAETASEQTGAQAESEETEAVSSAASLCGHGNGGESCPVCQVEDQISALPTLEEIAQMDGEGQNQVCTQAAAARDAYNALTEEEQAQVSNIDVLREVLDEFGGEFSLSASAVALAAEAAETVGAFTVTGGTLGTDYTYDNNVLIIAEGGSYTIAMQTGTTSTNSDRIQVTASDAVTITLVSVQITSSAASPFEINATGDVTIALSGENILTSTAVGYAGLQKTSTANTLTITSVDGEGSTEGSLTATGGSWGAGIGSGYYNTNNNSGNNIAISGGTVQDGYEITNYNL